MMDWWEDVSTIFEFLIGRERDGICIDVFVWLC